MTTTTTASVAVTKFAASARKLRYLNVLPAAHNYAMSSPGSLGVFLAGGRVILAADPSATLCFPLIEQHQINVASLVPPAVGLWLQAIREGAGMRIAFADAAAGWRRAPVGNAGGADSGGDWLPASAGLRHGGRAGELHPPQRQPGAHHQYQGCPMCPDDEVWVADADGNPLPRGEVGRLMTRGPYTFRGY
ncbi:hypothetical protein DMH17_10240 [Raoultella planticola]|nr:hypothetical protein [Raoultella planticola]